jgi:hypothetical protein
LEDCGYRHVPSGGSWGCNFVLGDNQGHRIDVHSFEIDTSGENTFGVAYRAEHLIGVGIIDGYQVRCVAPGWMVKFHTGYPLDKNDFSDVKALCEKFEIEMPEEHQAYWHFLAEILSEVKPLMIMMPSARFTAWLSVDLRKPNLLTISDKAAMPSFLWWPNELAG